MSYKKWLSISFSFIFLIIFIDVLFLYLTDTYSVSNRETKKFYTVPNQRHLIVEHLLKNRDKYDTFIFGSSRIGSINPLSIKEKKAYNMTYGEGVPQEHLLIVKLLLKNDVKINHLLIALDDFSFQVPFQKHQNQFMPKSHYLATGESLFEYYMFYYFRKPKVDDYRHFVNKFIYDKWNLKAKSLYYAIYHQKDVYSTIKGNDDDNSTEHMGSSIFKLPTNYDYDAVDNTLDSIQEIVDIAKNKNIEVVFFINPIHKVTYEANNIDRFKRFKSELFKITSYYDFSIPNKINNSNAYWNDTSHYNFHVGDLILSRIYDDNQSIENFGIYIEKEN